MKYLKRLNKHSIGLGIPEAEQKYLAGVSAQYESEVVYHNMEKELEDMGVIFKDTDSALRENEDLFREYFGKLIPSADNKFSALNSAVWSGGSFIYVPKNTKVETPLQATSVLTLKIWDSLSVR